MIMVGVERLAHIRLNHLMANTIQHELRYHCRVLCQLFLNVGIINHAILDPGDEDLGLCGDG